MIHINSPTDLELQQLAAKGDLEAERMLIQRYSSVVRACARPYFLAGGDSEDLIQEGMLGLLSAIREYSPAGGASFRTFAELCIRRRLYSAIKTAAGSKTVSLDDCLSLDSAYFDENQARAAYTLRDVLRRGPEETVIDREGSEAFFRAFRDRLSKFEAEILELYLQGMSYREIASRVNRSSKSVDNAVQRIRRKLAQFLDSGDISEN